MDETDDPGGNTAMFRAFVEREKPTEVSETASNRVTWIVAGVAAALVVLVVVALSLL